MMANLVLDISRPNISIVLRDGLLDILGEWAILFDLVRILFYPLRSQISFFLWQNQTFSMFRANMFFLDLQGQKYFPKKA